MLFYFVRDPGSLDLLLQRQKWQELSSILLKEEAETSYNWEETVQLAHSPQFTKPWLPDRQKTVTQAGTG